MISKFCGFYSLICDICGEEHPEQFFDFYEAVEAKKIDGWKSRKDADGNWIDVCDACLNEEQED